MLSLSLSRRKHQRLAQEDRRDTKILTVEGLHLVSRALVPLVRERGPGNKAESNCKSECSSEQLERKEFKTSVKTYLLKLLV